MDHYSLLKPILTAEQVREWDKHTIQSSGISSWQLMEQAAGAFVHWFTKAYAKEDTVVVVCGTGNNGGDGLAVARMLHKKGYSIEVYIVGNPNEGSADFGKNQAHLPLPAQVLDAAPEFTCDLLVDAIFGTGLSRPPQGLHAEVIKAINKARCPVISIDLPSGLYADQPPEAEAEIVEASRTLSFGLPKLSFLLPKTGSYVNYWQALEIGLEQSFPGGQPTTNYYLTEAYIRRQWKSREKWSHKGKNGKALLIAGSYGKMGACVLSAKACLRAGIGLLSLHIPRAGYAVVQTAVPEAMAITDSNDQHFSQAPEKLEGYTVLGIGPGLGTHDDSVGALAETLRAWQGPLVLDADALNILSRKQELLSLLPMHTILTPHPKELERLIGEVDNDFERLEKQKAFAQKHQLVLVVKGAHTSITLPDGTTYFNSTGNPALATGGTGDVLTGIILGMLGQGYPAPLAASLGVYLGGLAADNWAEKHGKAGMLASDIPRYLPKAIKLVAED